MNAQPITVIPPDKGWTTRDDTTRYLCAAVHLDSAYADEAIREFVVEPTRPIPPSPGYRPESVLTEAIAARTRRKLRDGALAVLMAAFVAMTWATWLPYGWLVAAVLVCLPRIMGKISGGRVQWSNGAVVTAILAAGAVGAFLVPSLLNGSLDSLFRPSRSSLYGDSVGSSGQEASDTFPVGLAVIPALLMLVILVVDRLVVWKLLTERFGSRTLPPRSPVNSDRPLLNLSPPRFLAHLSRYHPHNPPPGYDTSLIVYRGYNPFVGAGIRRESWSMVLPLEKLSDKAASSHHESSRPELTTALLYERVREAMSELQKSTALSPDRRLRDLRIFDAVYVSADELIDHLNDPATLPYLSNPDYPPNAYLPAAEVAALRDEPREWARYYLCFQVETWDRDLVLSSFLHAALDPSTLYLEWTPCVLPPLQDSYREVDKLMPGIGRPIWQALVRWCKLPVTIFGRTAHTVNLIRPLPRKPGRINSDAYGNLRTLREMGAAEDVDSYFQLVDIERYEKIMQSRLIPAISRVLRDCGYSPAHFEKQAEQIINNTFIGDINGPVNTGVVYGDMTAATLLSN